MEDRTPKVTFRIKYYFREKVQYIICLKVTYLTCLLYYGRWGRRNLTAVPMGICGILIVISLFVPKGKLVTNYLKSNSSFCSCTSFSRLDIYTCSHTYNVATDNFLKK